MKKSKKRMLLILSLIMITSLTACSYIERLPQSSTYESSSSDESSSSAQSSFADQSDQSSMLTEIEQEKEPLEQSSSEASSKNKVVVQEPPASQPVVQKEPEASSKASSAEQSSKVESNFEEENGEAAEAALYLQFPHSLEAKQKDYLSFSQKYPDLDPEQIVTLVNIGLNRPFYEGVEEVEDPNNLLVICNKYHRLPKDFVPKDLTSISKEHSVSGRNVTLRSDAAAAFEELCSAAKQAGYTILGQSGYRSYDYQKTLYNNYVKSDGQANADTYSARPGYSEHQTGLAIDVRNADRVYTDFGKTAEYQWAKENIYKYGFILHYLPGKQWITGYQTEEWHFRYVGKEAAKQIYELGITFDEYMATYH